MDPGREESCLKRMEAEKLSSTCNTERPQLSEAKIHCTHKERNISEPHGQTFSNQNMTKKNTLILVRKPLHLQFPTLFGSALYKASDSMKPVETTHTKHTNLKECPTSTKNKLNLSRLLAILKYISLSSLLFLYWIDFTFIMNSL